jgi:Fe-S-cluster-containing dehydrogenase component
MLIPTLEVPHFCAQCEEPACVPSCPVDALSIDKETKAIIVDKEKCISCGLCIDACPGRVPVMHPTKGYALICDLCGGEPECAKVCQEGRYNALWKVKRATSISYDLYAKTPDKVTKQLAYRFYRDLAEGLL